MTISRRIDVDGGVLVPHDGSPGATAALRTAVRCASVFGGRVEVVRVWTLVTAPALGQVGAGHVPSYEDFEASVLAALEQDVAPVRRENPDLAMRCSVVHGEVADTIVEASRRVDLIVMGARGHSRLAGALLGSISDEVVHRSICRVLVDRDGMRPPGASDPGVMEQALLSELGLGGPR